MDLLVWVASCSAGMTFAVYAAGLPRLLGFARGAHVRSIPRGETPPLTLIIPIRTGDDLSTLLRQNYPEFEALLVGGEMNGGTGGEARAVSDVKVRIAKDRPLAEAAHPLCVVASSDARPDPLFLRDAANGLAVTDRVRFVPVRFGMRTLRARLEALGTNTDELLVRLLLRGGGFETDFGAARVPPGAPHRPVAIASRPIRVHAPEGRSEARFTVPMLRVATVLTALAPSLLLATAILTKWAWVAIPLLVLIVLLRVVTAVIVDLAFGRDRSLLGSLPWLPVLWLWEPVARLAWWRRRRGHFDTLGIDP